MIASPPFVPSLQIEVSRVRVIQSVVLGRRYALQASTDGRIWTNAGPVFIATDEGITNEFNTDLTSQLFRVQETQ